MRHARLFAVIWVFAAGPAMAHDTGRIDFGRDVLPLFKAHCFDCHGPKQQKGGFRLDRRGDAMKGGTQTVIGPGNSAGSRLYLKLIGSEYGPQMPPDGPLSPEETAVIKRWIDQGAHWPDELAGQTPATVADPMAMKMMAALREGDRAAFGKVLRDEPGVANLKGLDGSTPLMFAALYADADAVRLLLGAGADPNIRNDAGATALMWAADDPEKTQLLIKAGAEVNARSDDGRTALLIAAGRRDAGAVVRLLLESGANPSVRVSSYRGPITALRQAADCGDEAVLRMLIERGVKLDDAGPLPFAAALNTNNRRAVDLLIEAGAPAPLHLGLAFIAPPFGDARVAADAGAVEALIKRGAGVNARDSGGRTILMLAACLDTAPGETVKTLLDHGADVHAKSADGRTALDFALLRGQTPIADLLVKAGAEGSGAPPEPDAAPNPADSPRAALRRSIPLLQRVDAGFTATTGCISCHHNTLAAMTISVARKHGVAVDEKIAGQQLKVIASYLDGWRQRLLQDGAIPGEADTLGHIVLGLAAQRYPPDATTDAVARFLKGRQLPDGRWRLVGYRPPIESSEFQLTAASMRALQLYAPKSRRAEYDAAIRKAADWLRAARPVTNEDRAFQLLGLRWAGGGEATIRDAAGQLLAEQRADGGWGQLPTLPSDAYATGQALVALHEAAAMPPTDAAYQRGVAFLLKTQHEDGSWFVRSRAIAFQPYFESGFPYGHDQWISAAATNWAAMALIPAAR